MNELYEVALLDTDYSNPALPSSESTRLVFQTARAARSQARAYVGRSRGGCMYRIVDGKAVEVVRDVAVILRGGRVVAQYESRKHHNAMVEAVAAVRS